MEVAASGVQHRVSLTHSHAPPRFGDEAARCALRRCHATLRPDGCRHLVPAAAPLTALCCAFGSPLPSEGGPPAGGALSLMGSISQGVSMCVALMVRPELKTPSKCARERRRVARRARADVEQASAHLAQVMFSCSARGEQFHSAAHFLVAGPDCREVMDARLLAASENVSLQQARVFA